MISYLKKVVSYLRRFASRRNPFSIQNLSNGVRIRRHASTVKMSADGALMVSGHIPQWSDVLSLYPKNRTSPDGLCFLATVKLIKGEIGISLVDRKSHNLVSSEIILESDGVNRPVSMADLNKKREVYVRIRNVSQNKEIELQLERYSFEKIGVWDIAKGKDDIISLGLKTPSKAAQICKNILYLDKPEELRDQVPIVLKYTKGHYEIPRPEKLWANKHERVILQSAKDLINLLPTYISAEMGSNNVELSREFFENYLYMNVVRVVNLYETLVEKYGLKSGKLLEIGSYFGSFALALQRLGYEVTAVDRYSNYGTAFDCYTELMKKEGVQLISTSREDEWDVIEKLPQFDCAISMAVIEHVPHTPRLFLEGLKRRVKKGGILAVDTPNLVRYWARKDFAEGKPNMMPIKDQFFCDIPFEGHHREFTKGEVEWMLKQTGLKDISTVMFDYNQFQFDKIYQNQLECVLKFIEDDSYADTILSMGVVG